jgi:DNA polymerase III delta subunit
MLYLVHGKSKRRKEFIRNLASKLSLTPQRIYDNDIQSVEIENLVSVQTGLFGDRELYVLDSLARTLDIKNLMEGYAESNNIFIFSEETITKPITKVFEQYQANIQDFGKEEKKKDNKFNMFSLTDALGARDKKNLWLLFHQAIKNGSPEEIHGILFWQVKNLALVKTSQTNPGMNPFVYQKTSGYAAKFTLEEIQKMARDLVHMFHNRDTYSTLDIEIEKFILSL